MIDLFESSISGQSGTPHLYQLLLSVFETAEFALGALSQLSKPVRLCFGPGDLIPHLLLEVLLLHRHRPVLLLSLFQSGEGRGEKGKGRITMSGIGVPFTFECKSDAFLPLTGSAGLRGFARHVAGCPDPSSSERCAPCWTCFAHMQTSSPQRQSLWRPSGRSLSSSYAVGLQREEAPAEDGMALTNTDCFI